MTIIKSLDRLDTLIVERSPGIAEMRNIISSASEQVEAMEERLKKALRLNKRAAKESKKLKSAHVQEVARLKSAHVEEKTELGHQIAQLQEDYRQILGHFNAEGHFEGDRVVLRTSRGDTKGRFSCQQLEDGTQEWFVVLGWPQRRSTPSQVFPLTRANQTPLSDHQLESITRGADGMHYLQGAFDQVI